MANSRASLPQPIDTASLGLNNTRLFATGYGKHSGKHQVGAKTRETSRKDPQAEYGATLQHAHED